MTEIQQHEPRKKRGVGRSKKLSTKVDLTPMVDLGFLLITFFVFTTTTATPTAMNLILPHADNKDSMITSESKTINLILAGNDKIFYYNGDSIINIRSTNYSPTGLRNVLLNKKAVVENMFGDAKETVVLIKPTKDANYKNIVDVIDEMLIDQISRYVLMEADKNEIASLTSKR
jgi:biopolymer transport protein ExbD